MIKYIYITTVDFKDEKFDSQEIKLKIFSSYSKTYEVIDNPDDADIVIICCAEFSNYGEKIRKNKYFKNYINKAFVISTSDAPLKLFRGVYSSARKSLLNFNRVRSSSYTLFPDSLINPYINIYKNHEARRKKYLFSFMGQNSHISRRKIFENTYKRKDIYIEDTTKIFILYSDLDRSTFKQENYVKVLLESKFALCPRGFGSNSFRVFESMQLGIAPVIISDDWMLPLGPKWTDFTIFIQEKDVENIEKIIERFEPNYKLMGKLAKEAYSNYFDEKNYFDYLIDNCRGILKEQVIEERYIFKLLEIIFIFYHFIKKIIYRFRFVY